MPPVDLAQLPAPCRLEQRVQYCLARTAYPNVAARLRKRERRSGREKEDTELRAAEAAA